MKLLIDIGNTALKWAYAKDGALVEPGFAVHGGAPATSLHALPASAVETVWISHVTGAAQEPALSEAVRGRFGHDAQFARTTSQWQGLRNRYREPERLGVDRWLAMIAAWHEQHGEFCVVDAGTALTADVVSGDGLHEGGFIAAGLATQQRAILGATRFATRDVDATQYRAGLGDDTESCVRQGALLACLGAIDRAASLAGEDARLLIGGGDAASLLPYLSPRWTPRPLLVLEGLLAIAHHSGT